ncbi:hypothetical protein ACIRL3_35150 [Streptomyces sp. NPDC102384]|uniref:hypothetical protein n=1 Tax=Streptomyces sp. NPDC102384 TaxID=3366166 RepID=UPI0038029A02
MLADAGRQTLEGGKPTTMGAGEKTTVNYGANTACGAVQTLNATVHFIDTGHTPDTFPHGLASLRGRAGSGRE